MMLYEMEDYHEVAALDTETETGGVYAEELLSLYEKLAEDENEEALVNIMQIYSDTGCFNKAMVFMEKITGLHADYGKKSEPVRIKPVDNDTGENEPEAVRLTEQQLKSWDSTAGWKKAGTEGTKTPFVKDIFTLVLLIHFWRRSTRALKYTASLKVNTSGFVTQ